jgi:iron complex transport system permease protein
LSAQRDDSPTVELLTRHPMPPSHLTRRRFLAVNAALLALLLASIVASVLVGSVHIDVARALQSDIPDNVDRVILFDTRLPRVLLAAVVGAALASAGVALQGLLRNPLAEPHLIGVSGGAALGAVAAIMIGGRSAFTEGSVLPLAAAAGALASVGIIYRLALVQGRLQPYVLLLAGVVYNAFAGALIMFANSIADFYAAHGLLFWLMGNLATQSYGLVAAIGTYAALGAFWLLLQTRHLNVLSLGEEAALQLGVNVDRTRRATFVASALLVGAVVSVSGMIGFVGLIVPHVMRLLIGPDHRLLLPASLLAGAVFLIWADTVARTLLGVVELPVGVVTALCGGPFFVYLLKREGTKTFG